jgi:hypothetical protein
VVRWGVCAWASPRASVGRGADRTIGPATWPVRRAQRSPGPVVRRRHRPRPYDTVSCPLGLPAHGACAVACRPGAGPEAGEARRRGAPSGAPPPQRERAVTPAAARVSTARPSASSGRCGASLNTGARRRAVGLSWHHRGTRARGWRTQPRPLRTIAWTAAPVVTIRGAGGGLGARSRTAPLPRASNRPATRPTWSRM